MPVPPDPTSEAQMRPFLRLWRDWLAPNWRLVAFAVVMMVFVAMPRRAIPS